jgi:hypothetical protein
LGDPQDVVPGIGLNLACRIWRAGVEVDVAYFSLSSSNAEDREILSIIYLN